MANSADMNDDFTEKIMANSLPNKYSTPISGVRFGDFSKASKDYHMKQAIKSEQDQVSNSESVGVADVDYEFESMSGADSLSAAE